MDLREKLYPLPLLNDSAQSVPVPAGTPLPPATGSPASADREELPSNPGSLGAGNPHAVPQQFSIRPLGSRRTCPEIRSSSLRLRRDFFESWGADGESRPGKERKSGSLGKGSALPVPRKPPAEKIAAVVKRRGSLSFWQDQGLVDFTKTGHQEDPKDSRAHVAKGWSSELDHIRNRPQPSALTAEGLPRRTGSQPSVPATAGPIKQAAEQRVGFGTTVAAEAWTKANERGSGSRIPDQEGQRPRLGVGANGGNLGSNRWSGGKGLGDMRTVVFKSDASATLKFGGRPGSAVMEPDWFRSKAKVDLRKLEVASESSPGLSREIGAKPVKAVVVVSRSPKLSYCRAVERRGPLKTTLVKPDPVEKISGQKLQSSETKRRSDSRTRKSFGNTQGDPEWIPGADEMDHKGKRPGGTERRRGEGSGGDEQKAAVIVRSLSVKNRIKCFEMLENQTGKEGPAQPGKGKPGAAGVSSLQKSFSNREVWRPGKETPCTDLGRGGRKPWEKSVVRTVSLDGRVKRKNPPSPFTANGESRKERNAGKGNDRVANQGSSEPPNPRSAAGSRGDDHLGTRPSRKQEEEDEELSDASTVGKERAESSSRSESDREVVLDSTEPDKNRRHNPSSSSDSRVVDEAASGLESCSVQPGRAGVTPGSLLGSQKLGTPSFLLTSSPVVRTARPDPAGFGSWPGSLPQWTLDQSDGSGSDSEDSVLTPPSELSQADGRSFSVSLLSCASLGWMVPETALHPSAPTCPPCPSYPSSPGRSWTDCWRKSGSWGTRACSARQMSRWWSFTRRKGRDSGSASPGASTRTSR
ncbi:uncharacterized protein si:dkey-92i15.4 isoform X1 [Polyodon spathula]|uniref:uncharacterized protein si:dkey-92i15.4 isoform X1 n=1 Tax=Polyodon spathula TaxID=7913 RepID=UPI001B7F4B69|nr:uncharacterized protein si:dkey-92i15.4 isoform X1 [Polyodon spathula]